MESSPGRWWIAGLLAGAVGLAASYLVAALVAIQAWPVLAVADLVIDLGPGSVEAAAIDLVGKQGKPLLVVVVIVGVAALAAWVGSLARRGWWPPAVALAALTAVASVAVLTRGGAQVGHLLPLLVGVVVWAVALRVLARLVPSDAPAAAPATEGARTQPSSRRGFLVGIGAMGAVAAATGATGRLLDSTRRRVEESRRLLRIADVTQPRVPSKVSLDVAGMPPWQTPVARFYQVDTAVVKPLVEPREWALRIHGMVDREVTLTYDDLLARQLTEDWITLNCVSNPVGGDLIGNAWWSGVRVAELLAAVGVAPEADAVLQTSSDGWTCGTPLGALTDDRNAMLALAMNGNPLTVEHGYPVRTLVPGLYGYVSACKWVVDWEVTKFSEFTAFWTGKGWAEQGPVKMSSRIDVPARGTGVTAGPVTVAGVAWSQNTGIAAVEVALDGGPFEPATLGGVPNDDTWMQWRIDVSVEPGDHMVRVRATDKHGAVQTGVERDVLPDGATGWHEVEFTAT